MTTQHAGPRVKLPTGKRKVSADATRPAIKGRPRKEPADAEAVEKRRTQLRVAQRAFRKRRETTIDELREQVASLHQRNDDLLATLRGFAERAVQSGLSEESSIDLLGILIKYSALRDADADVVHYVSPPTQDKSQRDNGMTREILSQARVTQSSITDAREASCTVSPLNDSEALSSGINNGYQLFGPDPDTTTTRTIDRNARASYTMPQDLYPPSSNGFDGTSFANRLRRRILECGYR